MKKILLMGLLSWCTLENARADGPASTPASAVLSIQCNDFISLSPLLPPGTTLIMEFETPEDYASGNNLGYSPMTVTATRSFKVKANATPFLRQSGTGGTGSYIPSSVNADVILKMKAMASGITGPTTTLTTAYTPVGMAGTTLVSGSQGSLSTSFAFMMKVTPGLTLNMSGTYVSNLTFIASLD